MSTKDQESRGDQDSNHGLKQSGRPEKFVFEVALSTAIAVDDQSETQIPAPNGPLTPEMLDKMNRYWRAANYLCIGQIYLFENPCCANR